MLCLPSVRALLQFRAMILCAAPGSQPVLDHTKYGCDCGQGGSGTAVDEPDRCCQVYDHCYTDAMQHGACQHIVDNPYTETYSYICDEACKTVTCPVGVFNNNFVLNMATFIYYLMRFLLLFSNWAFGRQGTNCPLL
ncbi:phospholipase A2, minor isoenzyme [Pleuronectes platessa]|uniref:phospholipase A2, minor isoenzyme n=1 Tax=Pleuronectes platessa TaxID=8262 RepID=UPI00232A7264|nr:phospholipase A2, minor isoenzyme [Pleuronectes platessa]